MSDVERYIRRATRGLWGQRKREAHMELRGAIEDKVYRYSLLGLDRTQGTAAALRDLGNPGTIARELGRVHVMPSALRSALLTGLAGLLGFQALAQVATIPAVYPPNTMLNMECRLQSAAELALMTAAQRARYERLVAAQGRPQQMLTRCRSGQLGAELTGTVLLSVPKLLAALGSGGVTVTEQAQVTPTTPLIVFGGAKRDLPEASYATVDVNGERYVASSFLIPFLKRVTNLPLRLQGLTNPVLSVGDLQLRLGGAPETMRPTELVAPGSKPTTLKSVHVNLGASPATVRATDMLAQTLIDQRRTDTALPLPITAVSVWQGTPIDPAAPRLAVPGKDGDLYAVVQNIRPVNTGGGYNETLWVRAREKGQIQFTDELGVKPLIVTSLDALDAATARKQKAAVVYKLDPSDLRNLKLTLVPAAQVKVVNP